MISKKWKLRRLAHFCPLDYSLTSKTKSPAPEPGFCHVVGLWSAGRCLPGVAADHTVIGTTCVQVAPVARLVGPV